MTARDRDVTALAAGAANWADAAAAACDPAGARLVR